MDMAQLSNPTDTQKPTARKHRIGAWPVAASGIAIAVGAFAGQLWLPLGFFAAALVGMTLAGLVEGTIGVFGAAIGVPVLRTVGSTIIHSPLYLPAAILGLLGGMMVRLAVKKVPGAGA